MYLPALSDTFLRRDFDFALYLGLCSSRSLERFLWVGPGSTYTFLALLFVWAFVRSLDDAVVAAVQLVVPVGIICVMILIMVHLGRVEESISPPLNAPERLQFHEEEQDPFDLYEGMPQPQFLIIEGADEEDERLGAMPRGGGQPRPKLNRHRRLLCCSSCGKGAPLASLQQLYVALVAWLSLFAGHNAMDLFEALGGGVVGIVLTVLLALILLFIVLGILPGVVLRYSVVTSV